MKKILIASLSMIFLVSCNQVAKNDINLESNIVETKIQSNVGAKAYWNTIMKKQFEYDDKNKNGFITLDEYKFNPNYPDIQAEDLFKKIDKNKDSKISLNEYQEFDLFGVGKDIFRKMFLTPVKNIFTCNEKFVCTGSINSKTEFMNLFYINTNTPKEYIETFNTYFYMGDKNKDGKITFSELEDIYSAIGVSLYNPYNAPPAPPQPSVTPYPPNP
ncbi:MAG: hypothetical protein AABZ74_08190 [Cyanobacteriota bacterium]